MSDHRDAEEGRVGKEEEEEKEKNKDTPEASPDTDTTALIEKIAEQTDPAIDEEPGKDGEEVLSTDDEAVDVEVEEVQVEPVVNDKHFTARVERIAKQAEFVHFEQGNRRDTLFYKIVLAGNVRVVSHVLDCLQQKDKPDVIHWLLMKGKRHRLWEIPIKNHVLLEGMRLLMFCVLAFISFLSTPVFYLVHSFTTTMFSKAEHRLAANINLPLAFAAFSQDEDMMKFFLTRGVSIKTSDVHNNNVFHYIADLSSESKNRALEIFTCLVKFINDGEVVKQLLGVKRNSSGLTAMEYCAKFGSPQLLCQMMNHPGLIQHTAFAAGKEDISFGHTETEEDRNEEPVEAITKLEFVDVSMYEAGLFRNLSTLLNMLSDRDITGMSKEDLSIFDKTALVGKWMNLKVKQTFLGITFFHMCDILVTTCLILVLMNGLGSTPYIAQESNAELEVMLKEMKANSENKSYMFDENALVSLTNAARFHNLRVFLETHLEPNKYDIYTLAIKRFPALDAYYNYSIENFTMNLNTTPDWVIANVGQAALELPKFKDKRDLFYVSHFLQDVITDYSRGLFHHNPHLLQTEVDITNREFIEGEIRDFFDNFTTSVDNVTIQPSKVLSFWDFQHMFCVSKEFYNEEDLKETDYAPPPPNIYRTSCGYQAMMELANEECGALQHQETYKKFEAVGQLSEQAYLSEMIFQFVVILAVMYIVLDIVERFVFVYSTVTTHTNALDMAMSVLSKKVPGSYTHRQFNILTYFAFIGRFIVVTNKDVIKEGYGWTGDEVQELGDLCIVVGLVFRFVMHIHAFRLLPSIGNFVITTFMMGTNLIHFSAVYGAVLFIFSIIFHMLIQDPVCPVKKHDGFTTILESMFSIFKLTFGHGDFDAYYTSTPVQLTYTLYTIIVGLLLMNLIIAIMSTTATEIMTEPWKEILWRIEWLDEALSVEYTFYMLAQPFKRLWNSSMWSHKRAGFQVIQAKDSSRYRVFIEVFKCKALEKDEC